MTAGGAAAGGEERLFRWAGVRCRLLYYYRDVPSSYYARSNTLNLVVWHVLKGSVRVSQAGLKLEAKAGDWVVIVRGAREQQFSSDAYIESIHVHVDAGAAEWSGEPAVVLPGQAVLERASGALRRLVADKLGPGRQPVGAGFVVENFEEQVRLQGAVWDFMGRLIPVLKDRGMELKEPVAGDRRIERSMARIDALPLGEAWPRDGVAAAVGMSASQLDRVWRHALGRTPCQYWDARRLRFARERLEHSADSIKQVALELGFVHMPQFSNWFRSRLGVSPRSYRQRCA